MARMQVACSESPAIVRVVWCGPGGAGGQGAAEATGLARLATGYPVNFISVGTYSEYPVYKLQQNTEI